MRRFFRGEILAIVRERELDERGHSREDERPGEGGGEGRQGQYTTRQPRQREGTHLGAEVGTLGRRGREGDIWRDGKAEIEGQSIVCSPSPVSFA